MPNVSPAAQAKVAAVRALLERMTVPCPGIEIIPGEWSGCVCVGIYDDCPTCEGVHVVPDPAYDGLRELVEYDCPCTLALDSYAYPHVGDDLSAPCAWCLGRFKVEYNWGNSLSGSLYGAVEHGDRLPKGWHLRPDAILFTYTRNGQEFCDAADIPFDFGVDDPDLAIMTALEAALTAKLEAANAHLKPATG